MSRAVRILARLRGASPRHHSNCNASRGFVRGSPAAGRNDAELNMDGRAKRPDGKSAAGRFRLRRRRTCDS